MTTNEILRYTAFSADPAGGNPAGIVLDAAGLDDQAMLAIAAELGYSESAFLTAPPEGLGEPGRAFTIRYFSPKAEVSFCGHATVATAVALGERTGPGELVFASPAGPVPVTVTETDGELRATLTSVEPHVEDITAEDLTEALAALDWPAADLDPAMPPRIAYAGARHLVLGAATRGRLADLAYDFARLEALMHRLDLTTVQLVHRASETTFHVRDPFPVGGVVEDPATGAAAAAFGAYARELGLVPEESVLTLHQGEDMGRPGVLTVELRAGDPRVRVGGAGARIPDELSGRFSSSPPRPSVRSSGIPRESSSSSWSG
ncbi:PhzF family phenazine biosynthesis isomerase [Streptomyces sp. NPDC051219]|uniref:PhzF family phenazine biosynthesis protein n=1 Tax=Streptomyces sp. NPDC051219 TaxID=3155283 RepID=UPI00341F7678